MNKLEEITDNLILELRRGTLVLSVLSQLKDKKYGYALVETLDEKGLHIDPGTLYPLLRRLEKQELLTSEWETSGNKPRKYYVLTDAGKQVYRLLIIQWKRIAANVDDLTEGE